MGDSDEAKVYVGNLTYATSNDDLKELFKECGAVQSVNIIVDRDSGQSKGFGFVTFESSKSAGDAIKKFNDCEFNGRCLNVNTPKPQSERRNRGGGGYGGGGGGGYGGGGGGYGGGGGGRGGRGGGCGQQQNYGGGGGGF